MLIVGLPHDPRPESFDFVSSADGLRVMQQGACAPQDLPADQTLVAILPASRLTWHRLKLPPLPRHQRLAAAIGLLEDQWLQPAASLHISLIPMAHAKPGEDNHWACACDAQWLHLALQPLAQNGRMPQRLVPDFAPVLPGRPESVFLTGPQDAATLIWCRPQGVLWSPLPCPWPLLQATPVVAQVEPGAAQLLATLSGHLEQATVHSQTRAERWLQATALPWDLATGTWSQTPLQRFWRQVQSLARALWHDPSWKPARVALLGLVLAQGLGLNAWSWFMGQELLGQKQALNALLTQTFPQTRLVVDAPLQMRQALLRLQQQVGAPTRDNRKSCCSSCPNPKFWQPPSAASATTAMP